MPPPGLEWSSGRKIEMPLDKAARWHVLPQSELDRRIKAGAFSTLEICEEGDVKRLNVTAIYAQKSEIGGCFVFWQRLPAPAHRRN
jgi:hypothetical protein